MADRQPGGRGVPIGLALSAVGGGSGSMDRLRRRRYHATAPITRSSRSNATTTGAVESEDDEDVDDVVVEEDVVEEDVVEEVVVPLLVWRFLTLLEVPLLHSSNMPTQ